MIGEGKAARKEEQKKKREGLVAFALMGNSDSAFWVGFTYHPPGGNLGGITRLGGWQLVLLLLANGMILLLMNGRWWLILSGQGHTLPYLTLTAYRLAGASLSYITPGPQFGGEPLQILLIERHYLVPRATAVATIALDKTLELIVNFSFLMAGVVLIGHTQILGARVGWPTAVVVFCLLSLPLGCLLSFWLDWRIFYIITAPFIVGCMVLDG